MIEKHIDKPDGIECRYFMPDSKISKEIDILILRVDGIYPDGSLGNSHAAYISIMAVQGLQAFNPEAFVLDLRNLEYRWGNSLLGVLQNVSRLMDSGKEDNEPYFPIFVTTSDKSAGFVSLVTPSSGKVPEWHFKDIDEAINKAIDAGKEWIEF